jgi:hypothetical protein
MNTFASSLAAALLLIGASAAGAQETSGTSGPKLRLAQAKTATEGCPQVISCGTKDGVRKQYSDPCKARDDGATDIKPKGAGSCAAETK